MASYVAYWILRWHRQSSIVVRLPHLEPRRCYSRRHGPHQRLVLHDQVPRVQHLRQAASILMAFQQAQRRGRIEQHDLTVVADRAERMRHDRQVRVLERLIDRQSVRDRQT